MVDELSKRRMAAAKLVQQRSESLDENDFNRTLKSVKNTLNFEKNKGNKVLFMYICSAVSERSCPAFPDICFTLQGRISP